MKKRYAVLVLFAVVIVFVNAFPVKFVGRLKNMEGFTELDCVYGSDGVFRANSKSSDIEGVFEETDEPFEFIVKITANSPLNVLSEREFDSHYFKSDRQKTVPLNRFLLYGNIESAYMESGEHIIEFEVKKWSLYNSVNRLSFRKYVVPNDWLTFADFDIPETVKHMFSENR